MIMREQDALDNPAYLDFSVTQAKRICKNKQSNVLNWLIC